MKINILLLSLLFLFFSFPIMSQVPISILKNTDMNFGTIAVSDFPGIVILSTSGSRIASGGVFLPAFTGTFTAAQFTVSGEPNYTYTITLPVDFTLYEYGVGPAFMVVNDFTSLPPGTGSLSAGTETILVGATLNAEASQVAGSYSNIVGLDVIVNYN